MSDIELPEPGIYRHYKGDLYEVQDNATMSNTDQEGRQAVIYRSVNRGTLWVRTLTGPDGWGVPTADGRERFTPYRLVDEPPFPYPATVRGRHCVVKGLDAFHPEMRSVDWAPLDYGWVRADEVIPDRPEAS